MPKTPPIRIPQFDSLARLMQILRAMADGTGLSGAIEALHIPERQAQYAQHTLNLLALTSGDVDSAELTEAGRELGRSNDQAEQRGIFKELLLRTEIGRRFPELFWSSFDRAQVEQEIEKLGYSKSTAFRRSQTLERWWRWANAPTQADLELAPVAHYEPEPGSDAMAEIAMRSGIVTRSIDSAERDALLSQREGHFLDFKSRRIEPSKLSRTISAFANADGGDVYVGVEDSDSGMTWDGFATEEAANATIQVCESLFPMSLDFQYSFIVSPPSAGLILHIQVAKTREIKHATDQIAYLRRSAQNLPQKSADEMARLRRTKGLISFEDETVVAGSEIIIESDAMRSFIGHVVPTAEPRVWLTKQQLLIGERPTVAGLVLFADVPQATLPKAAIKIYRYRTTSKEGTRDSLDFNPITIEGPIYDQIRESVRQTVVLTEKIPIMGPKGLEAIQYPEVSLHEIITNAVLHRDYALNDDVHVRIFDDRIEVESPGRLPAHITTHNILVERFARNPKVVRLINKFPEPPNKDVGEGLNTAFQAMKKLGLRDPEIQERENSVLVYIRHERLASPESTIMDYVRHNQTINNSTARRLTGIESEISVRKLLKKLVRSGELEQIPGTVRSTTAYRVPSDRKE